MNRSFDVLLWDVDGTLLDFLAAEDISIRSLFKDFGLGECTDEMLKLYSGINAAYWKKLEKGEMSKPEILVKRFETFFSEIGFVGVDCAAFDKAYQKRLGETVVFRDDSYELVKSLKGKIPQYAASNGTTVAQIGKLTNSGLINLLDGVFLAEQLGAEKPSPVFFEKFKCLRVLLQNSRCMCGHIYLDFIEHKYRFFLFALEYCTIKRGIL